MLCPDLDNEEDNVWMADELEPCAFAKLGQMKVVSSRFTAVTSKLNGSEAMLMAMFRAGLSDIVSHVAVSLCKSYRRCTVIG